MDEQEALQLAIWAKRESEKLTPTWGQPGSPMERDVIQAWRLQRPKMVAALELHQGVVPLAHVLVDQAIKAEVKYLQAGMPQTDAREQAERDWLMLEPEDDEDSLGDVSEEREWLELEPDDEVELETVSDQETPVGGRPRTPRPPTRFLIDAPNPFAPTAQWRAFLSQLAELPQGLPEVQDAVSLARTVLAERSD